MCCLGLLLLGCGCQDLSPARSPSCLHGTCASFLSSFSRFRVGHPCALHLYPEVSLFGGVLCWSFGPEAAPKWPHITDHRRRCPGRKEDIRLIRIQASTSTCSLQCWDGTPEPLWLLFYFIFLLYIYTLNPCLIASDSVSTLGALRLFSSSQAIRDFPAQLGFGVHLSPQQESLKQVGCQELEVSLGYTI